MNLHARSKCITRTFAALSCVAACLFVAWPCDAQNRTDATASDLWVAGTRSTIRGQTDGTAWIEHYWPNGQLASVLCDEDPRLLPLNSGRCRYKDFTGALVTHHADGSVSEILHLLNGVLDGLAESYDPQGTLIERLYFSQGVSLSLDRLSQLSGQRLGPAEPRPEPAVQPLPAPPSIGSAFAVNEIPGTGRPGRFLPRPPHRLTFEIGATAPVIFGFSAASSFTELDLMSQVYFLLHVHRWLTTEVDLAVMPNWALNNRGNDWPILRLGLRVPLGHGNIAPYLLSGAGVTTATSSDLGTDPNLPIYETAWYLGIDGGLGVAWHISEHLVLNLDTRVGRNFRVDGGPHIMVADDAGTPQEVMGSYYFFATNLGIGVQL